MSILIMDILTHTINMTIRIMAIRILGTTTIIITMMNIPITAITRWLDASRY